MQTPWQTPAIGSPCWVEVGERSAPVPQKRIFFNLPLRSLFSSSPQSTTALHPLMVLLLVSAGGMIAGAWGMMLVIPAVVSLRGALRGWRD